MSEKSNKVGKITEYWRLVNSSRRTTIAENKWKNEHNGKLPKDVWLDNLENVGSYSCVEVLPYDSATEKIYLKRRSDPTAKNGEKEWEGKLHIPGITEIPTVAGKNVLPNLLKKEILKDEIDIPTVIGNLSFLTQIRYPEPERNTTANTLVLLLPIDPILLQDDFLPVSKENLQNVIDQHKPLLEAYWSGNGKVPLIMDTRQK